jgi:hypothetical protein
MSELGLICAVAGLTLLGLFGAPGEDTDLVGGGVRTVSAVRVLDQVAAVAGVALLIAAGIFQAGQAW